MKSTIFESEDGDAILYYRHLGNGDGQVELEVCGWHTGSAPMTEYFTEGEQTPQAACKLIDDMIAELVEQLEAARRGLAEWRERKGWE